MIKIENASPEELYQEARDAFMQGQSFHCLEILKELVESGTLVASSTLMNDISTLALAAMVQRGEEFNHKFALQA